LRTPAAFCGVASLRPSPGLVATNPGLQPFGVYSQTGPMARTVADLALFTDAMTGSNSLAGLAKARVSCEFGNAAAQAVKPSRIAYSEDLGVTRTSPEVTAVCNAAIAKLEREGIDVDNSHPDLSMMDAAFEVPRALDYAQSFGADHAKTRDIMKPEVVWNIEKGLNLDADEIRASMDAQGQIFVNASQFMQGYDCLICPATILPAYPVEERYPGYSEGLDYSEYYGWLAICCAITATTLPVIMLPCGKTEAGLPIGLQIIGKPHGEHELFSNARYLEQVFAWDPLQVIGGR
jgi:amidase